jgi:RimJ/RimL family protein N-acetyltransferase
MLSNPALESMFNIDECTVRLARHTDRQDLLYIAQKTWGGHDYLPEILDRWMDEDWFFVCEYQAQVISCIKLSRFPNNVLWIEGLRVHPRFRGKGIAGLMNLALFDFAKNLVKKDPACCFECCIYFANPQSSHLTQKFGFKKQNGFFYMERRGLHRVAKPRRIRDFNAEIFEYYPEYLPLNWHAVHSRLANLPFIGKHAEIYRSPNLSFLLGTTGDRSITLLSEPKATLAEDLPYLQYFFGPRKNISIILSDELAMHLQLLMDHKFRFWEMEDGIQHNMLVLQRQIDA